MTGSRRSLALLALILLMSAACPLWFASAELNGRNWDEGHSLRNIRSILSTGSWRPSFAFYPALSHLPQAALMNLSQGLYESTGNRALQILKPNGNFTATAFVIGRSTSVVYSLCILLLVHRVGRRIFSEEVGLLAAAVLAVSPSFLKVAGTYKPDALLVLTALAAFAFAVRAAEQGRAKHYLLAGAAVGLSASGKQNGAFSSIPLILATAAGYRETTRWFWLAGAGALSVVVFLIFNPWPELLPEYLSMGKRYVTWAGTGASAGEHILVFAARLPFHWAWHGLALGTGAWLGLIGLAVQAIRRRGHWPEQAGPALLVLFVVIYPLACAVVSSRPKPNIFVPTLPFTALAAAWALARTRRLLLRHLDQGVGRSVVWLGSALLFVVAAVPYWSYLYRTAVPETRRAASEWIERSARLLDQRTIVTEAVALGVGYKPWQRQTRFPLELVPRRLSELPSLKLDLADYEVFPQSALEGSEGGFYQTRIDQLGLGGVRVFDARVFRRRGEVLVVLAHPWRVHRDSDEAAAVIPVEWRRQGRRRLYANVAPRFRPGHVISLDLALTPPQVAECHLEVDGAKPLIHLYHKTRPRSRYMSPRFVAKRRSAPIRFACPRRDLFEPRPEIGVIRWALGRARPTAS